MLNTDGEAAVDLVEGGDVRQYRARPVVVAALCALVVGVAAGYVAGRGAWGGEGSEATGGGSPQAMTGEMVLGPVRPAENAGQDRRGNLEREMSGTITLAASGPHSGTVHLRGSTSTLAAGQGPNVYHGWGTIDAVLDGAACTGTYAWTYFAAATDSGGSMHLRCRDGRLLAGRLTVTTVDHPVSGTGTWRIGVRVEDGFYLDPRRRDPTPR